MSALIAVLGLVVLVWSIADVISSNLDSIDVLLITLLTLSAIVCARFPIRMGLGQTFVSLDSIPLVLVALLLDPSYGFLVGALCATIALLGQPSLPGVVGAYWRVFAALGLGLGVAASSWIAGTLGTRDDGPGPVLLITAFVAACVLEACVDLFVLTELESDQRGQGVAFLRAWTPLAANVLLATLAAAVLTPYIDRPWAFTFLLPLLLAGMYGALWVANSQQMEKRRGARLKDTFSRYVPEGIVDDNLDTMQQVELGGEQRDVSVLFCDIRGFTSWSEDKGATEVIAELNVLLTALSDSVMSTGGTLDKFTGDGLMAFWGAPVPTEEHAERACRAALDMLLRLNVVNTRREADGHEPFAIGIGVHSGTAVVGNVGHERRLDYTAIGDTVNTAARLEATTKEIGAVLLVSRHTVELLEGELRDRAMRVGDVSVKGKNRPIEVWALQPLRPELDDVDDEFAA